MNIKAFIISLPNAVNRRPQVEKIRSICPIPSEVISAVDGRAMSDSQRQYYVGEKLYRPYFPFKLRPGEVGHFLSQRKAWQTIVDQKLEAALLLEDDIELDNEIFGRGLALAIESLREVDIIKFRAPTRQRSPQNVNNGPTIQDPPLAPLGTTSLLISNGAAVRLLGLTRKFDRPTDAFLQLSWITGIRPRIIVPAGVQEISHLLGGSSIQSKKRTFSETLYRNIARPWYRLQLHGIARLPSLLTKQGLATISTPLS